MVNMKDIAVHYDKISAFDMLVDIARVAGVESIQTALNEIAAQQSVQPTGGTHSQLVSMVNSLANIIIEASGKDGYLSSNDLDYANDCLDKVIPLLKPTSG
jgi:hypothetical protein